jgi:N-acylglucosamine 2-epimerase
MQDIPRYIEQYSSALLQDVIPFWEKYSPDAQCGGYFTCLDQQGRVFDTDKFIWLQCRQVWTFAMLYNRLDNRQRWLDLAMQGADFLLHHGRAGNGHWYFSLTREGKPLTAPYNIFSDCFAAMAFAQLYQATGSDRYKTVASETFHHILERRKDPKGIYSKSIVGTRPLRSFSLPMILSNLVLELEPLLDPLLVEQLISGMISEVMTVFYKRDWGVILEQVGVDGSFSDSFEGRLVNPGHGLEAMWFIMELAARRSDEALMGKAKNISLDLLRYGYDQQYGGIFYFLDVKGNPPQQLEWDQKLWWVHQEALLALLKGYLYTDDPKCWEWFEILHAYTWEHFPDRNSGEWFGYLNRRGEVLLSLKGGKWKGCFHTPRFLYQGWKTLTAIVQKQQRII